MLFALRVKPKVADDMVEAVGVIALEEMPARFDPVVNRCR
jgi:hypothetical protein